MTGETIATDSYPADALSAQGTRLNRRGRENRQAILATAVRCLATGAPDARSANRIAKEAGVTWGTIQHQFGDTDGVWAAVIDDVAQQVAAFGVSAHLVNRTLERQVSSVVDWMWRALNTPEARAVQTIRVGLPRDHAVLAREWPKTAAAIEHIDDTWSALIAGLLDGLVDSKVKLARVRQLLPAAMHGIQMQAELSSLTDADEARRALADAITAYLTT